MARHGESIIRTLYSQHISSPISTPTRVSTAMVNFSTSTELFSIEMDDQPNRLAPYKAGTVDVLRGDRGTWNLDMTPYVSPRSSWKRDAAGRGCWR